MKTNAAIAGSRIRYDVPTKCMVVETILTTKHANKDSINAQIESIAVALTVNPITIKLWCSQYADIFLIGKQLAPGTMSFVIDPLDNTSIKEVLPKLEAIRNSLAVIKSKYHKQNMKTPSEILEELLKTN